MSDASARVRTSAPVGRTAFALIALQGVLHVFSALREGDPRMVLPHAVAWLHDAAMLTAVAAVLAAAARPVGSSLQRAVMAAARGATVATGLLLSLYPQTLQTFLATPVNILQADTGAAAVFLRDYAGVRVLWPAGVAAAVGMLAPRLRWLRPPRRWTLAGVPLLALFFVTLGRISPNPVLFSLQDTAQQLFVPRAVPRVHAGRAADGSRVGAPQVDWAAARQSRYDHVLLVVLEGVTSTEFERQFLTVPGGFFATNQNASRYFTRYHATNLDSYTSLIAMTTSILVPFRAYADPERYRGVNDGPNLVRGSRGAGYRTLFVSTYEHQPFVPNARDWDRILDRGDLGDLGAWVSVGGNRMEAATEDRAALPAIMRFMMSAPRSLVLAELVFGHAPAWRAKTGLTALGYYDRYLTELQQHLTKAGLVSRTLLVIVSDHGKRSLPAVPDNFRVPLLLMGPGVEPGQDAEFRSHLDLQAIVASAMTGSPMPPARDRVFTVGSTERWVYGEILRDGSHAFVDDSSGRVLAGTLDPTLLHHRFERYVSAFLATF